MNLIFMKYIFTHACTISLELVNCFIEVLTNSILLLTFGIKSLNQATGHHHQATVSSFFEHLILLKRCQQFFVNT